MNRNRYRLVFNETLGMMVPVSETARRQGKSASGRGGSCSAASGSALALAGVLLGSPAWAELPVASVNYAAPGTTANYHTNGAAQAYMNQVGNKAVVNFDRFNISAGHDVLLRQVHQLPAGFNDPAALVQGAQFTTLARIHDLNPSIIAGSISQAAGQKANLILVNSNGIAFMGGSQVNLNSFTASTLDIQDRFLDTFLPQGESSPQFANALDGGAARGFIKVMEGARITAGSQGRVMLIAPTVVNKGKVEAADGQVIVAAASKVYLRSGGSELNGLLIEVDSPAGLNDFDTANTGVADGQLDGQTVSLANATEDKLGHATNLGELTTPRGNVTMVGFAVNQNGIARATTSVVAGGSVYLMAKDTAVDVATQTPGSARAGRVTLGRNSLTEILPETSDTATTQDGTAGTGLDRPSRVRVVGQDIRIEGKDGNGDGGAQIIAPSGTVELVAVDNPKNDFFVDNAADMFSGGSAVSNTARVHIADGARIDVSGLKDVEVAAGRSVIEIELRGDELKDSPVNQVGPLRGQKVFIDVDRALAESDAGKPTLVARDTLLNLKAQQQRTVAERSTAGGAVKVYSKGEAIVESGATIDLSGGSLKHLPGNIKTTRLSSGGQSVDVSEARADVRYDGITTRFVIDYGRWNRQDVIDLGPTFAYSTGFQEGRDAGQLETFGIGGLYARPDIVGKTVTGERQRDLGLQPRGARWVVGYDDVSSADKNQFAATGYTTQDYKLNQTVVLADAATNLPAGFRFGDALPAELKTTLALDSGTLGAGKVAELSVLSNQAIAVRDALAAPQAGAVVLTGAGIEIAADITALGGTVDLTARNTARQLADVLPDPTLRVLDGVKIATHGTWTNDAPALGARTDTAPQIDGGTIRLTAQTISDGPGSFISRGDVEFGNGVTLDADAGAWRKADGKVAGGDGGSIAISGFDVSGLDGVTLHAYGVDDGGSLTLGNEQIRVGSTAAPASGVLDVDTGFFARGGFATYALNALTRLEVADGARIAPSLVNRELEANSATRASGTPLADVSRLETRPSPFREAVDLTLRARQGTAQTGNLVVGTGARIELDPGANLTLDGLNQVDIDGVLRAQGGTVTASSDVQVRLGSQASFDVSGIGQTYVYNRGLTQGTVRAGGTVDMRAASVVAEAGSRIDVSGAAPVRLDAPNENGSLGRTVGSEGGALNVFANGSIRLDGTLAAQGGAAGLRGGRFTATLGEFVEPGPGQPLAPTVLRVMDTVAPGQTDGATRIATRKLEEAGFDRIQLSSRDAIRIEGDLDVGAGRALPLRELTLDAAAILTDGGNSTLRADTLKVGNLDPARRAASAATTSTGTLALEARLLDLVGNFELGGMATATLTGTEAVRFSGTTTGTVRPTASLRSSADLAFHGAVVAPASYTQASILAPGRTVQFTRNTDTPVQPLAALGSLSVQAENIVQDGNLWAPLGQLVFEASDSLVFRAGSLTSVAADPGSLLPFGKTQNGRSWIVDLDPTKVPTGQLVQDELPGKALRVSAQTVDMQAGAKVDLSGGGDLQAYEFTVGPGGSRDILADANTYAILPGFAGGFAPADAQEGFDRASGEAVYLSGVPGLADGVYTLLPAHYALLPGAYAVQLDAGLGEVLPGQAYSRQDGVRIAAGYVTDTRANAPRDASWQGIRVMTRDQVRARSEFALTRASEFFASSGTRPQDAGLLSVSTSGSGAGALKLDAIYDLAAATGGQGAAVDVSALKLAVVSGTPAGIDPDAVVLDAADLNALGADSLLLGGTRSRSSDTITITVGATSLTLANDAGNALTSSEVMLAASDTLTLKAGSAVNAQGAAGDAGQIRIAGNGAFVRAASTQAGFARTGSPDRSAGTLVGEAGSTITAADSITLDATRANQFKGTSAFVRNGVAVAGKLAVGATRINFGNAPTGSDGLTYTQAELDNLDLAGLALISYSTFDLYGDVSVGRLDGNGKPLLQSLTLQGAGLAGIDNAGQTAQINARNLTLSNPDSAAAFAAGGTLGNGSLAVTADTLTLGQGDKAIRGFGDVTVTANELVAASGTGKLDVDAPLTLNVARISGQRNASQTLNSSDALVVASHTADRTLAPVDALGAKWAFSGSQVDFDSRAELPSGSITLAASTGDVHVGSQARIDVAGRSVQFFDVEQPSWGGTAEFISAAGDVVFDTGARVDVSAAPGGDAGTLVLSAASGNVTVADGTVQGNAPTNPGSTRGEGARVQIDAGTLANFSSLNTALNSGGFDGVRDVRVRSGNVGVAAGDTVRAQTVRIAADNGQIDVAGTLDASGEQAGRIELWAHDDVNVLSTASVEARATGAGETGGDIVIGTVDGQLDLASGSQLKTTGGAGGQSGSILLRAPRINGDTDVAVAPLASTITGARSIAVEAVKTYTGIDTLNATGASGGSTLTLATISADNTAFAGHAGTIKTRLGRDADPAFHLRSGVEVRSSGDLALAQDWNLKDDRADGEAGVLTLRAQGNLNINSNLSDGFSHATPCTTGACPATGTTGTPATLLAGESWSYRLVGGADALAADPLATTRNTASGNVALAGGKLIRTGTGDIDIAAGGNVALADASAAIYTAGRLADPLAGFTPPVTNLRASYTTDGGDVRLQAQGDIATLGNASPQLFSQWLFRQGAINSTTGNFVQQPSWWVRFDQFRQGVGTLGGGNIDLVAGGKIANISASAASQGRTSGASPETAISTVTGGGAVSLDAGGDVLGGAYYSGLSNVQIRAKGRIGAGIDGLKPVIALGDARAYLRALGDIEVGNAITPQMLPQSAGNLILAFPALPQPVRSLFSTYSGDSAISLASLSGDVVLHQDQQRFDGINSAWLASLLKQYLLPASIEVTGFQGGIDIGAREDATNRMLTMMPSATGSLALRASGNVRFNDSLTLSDMDPVRVPNALRPTIVIPSTNSLSPGSVESLIVNPLSPRSTPNLHASIPLHTADDVSVRVYSSAGDILGINDANTTLTVLDSPKKVDIRAGRDVSDLAVHIQHLDEGDVSRIVVGRDIRFGSPAERRDNARIRIGGPGRLDIIAGEDIDLGTSGGIVSRGKLDNIALPVGGASLRLAAGVEVKGVDAVGAVDRVLQRLETLPSDDTTLWLARWLVGDDSLTAGDALTAVRLLDAANEEEQQERVVDMLFTALRETGRQANQADSGYAANFTRGYAALDTVFPGIDEKNVDGTFKNFQGDINLFASRIKTEQGGSIQFLAPGGNVIVGLANTPSQLVVATPGQPLDVLGMVVAESGDIQGFARKDIVVNQSRILTVGGGDVLLWSSEGDIDAGKGKKSASVVPPPLVQIDTQGNVTLIQQGAVNGSGIGALTPLGGIAGDVDLIAPRGAVDAGDAGIRAGNLNIAAQVVLGADNISVSGSSSGTPVADTSAVTAASSGASNAGGDVSSTTAALAQNLSEAARAAEDLKNAFKPTFISAEVIGYGE